MIKKLIAIIYERHDYHEDGCGYEENGIFYCVIEFKRVEKRT